MILINYSFFLFSKGVKSKINSITTIHVYSIQKSIPKDFNLLCARECNLKTAGYQNSCKNPELILEKAKYIIFH